ncbi:threonine-phosphate decarboxylase CobD [Paenibacillus paeoniae]|uniref:threonine-phosphate decarboxylase n=1 Tax=Paenibacillus paeoniae TaxID=2292705 RepID=A0A371PKZ0_9BACL|nr:threonine-phosphate decarboxylase CobD [Paenibacillus paeoniae]REK76625.1 threonine-phosphate decarboxylase [Paenibacillus paeoniae]
MLERYGHGGDLRTAEECFGLPSSSFLDFSSNMNPLGPPDAVRETLARYAVYIDRYPDPVSRKLSAMLSERHGVEESAILIGNGAAELIDLVVRGLRPRTAAVAVPCFSEYGDAIRKTEAALYEGRLHEADHYRLEKRWVEKALEQTDANLYMLGSPNNPTGALVEPDLVKDLLAHGAAVVVDEAFMDFVPEEESYSLAHEASQTHNLFVIRSMTKFYSIPGIRLGYMLGHPEKIAELRRLQVPWSVNSLAQSIGEAVLADEAFVQNSMRWLQEERPWLMDQLEALGFHVYSSKTNYLLLRLPNDCSLTSTELQGMLGLKGVLIRDGSRFPGLDERHIRIAVKLREQNERLIAALKACIWEQGGITGDGI